MSTVLEFEWLVLLLRLAFIGVLYFFLYQLVRLTSRELVLLARQTGPSEPAITPPRLIVVEGTAAGAAPGTVFVVGPLTTIGRHAGHDVVLDDPFVSGDHAELRHRGNQWWIVDLASTNGTFVNGDPVVGQQAVRLGDIVQFGRIKLRFAA